MGKDANEERERKGTRSIKGRGGSVADYEGCNSELLRRAIATASSSGGALRLGYSRDGGAYAIGIYYDGQHHTEFVSSGESLDDFLTAICEWYEDQRDNVKSSVKGKK